jgi:glutathione S-transferase
MSQFTLYGVPASPYVRAAAMGLNEKGVSFRMCALGPMESRSAAYLKRNPFGKVPSFVHGEFELYETQAILRYLDRIIPEPSFTPRHPRAEARMNQLCGITDCYVMPYISMGITFDRLVAPMLGIPVDEAKIKACLPRAQLCVAEIARILGDNPFLTGEGLSIADLLLAPHLSFFTATLESEGMLKSYQGLNAWLNRMSARPSFQNATAEKLAAKARSWTQSVHTVEIPEEIL